MNNNYYWIGGHTAESIKESLNRKNVEIAVPNLAAVITELKYDQMNDTFYFLPVSRKRNGEEEFQYICTCKDGFIYFYMPEYSDEILAIEIDSMQYTVAQVIRNITRNNLFSRLRFNSGQPSLTETIAKQKEEHEQCCKCGMKTAVEEEAKKQRFETMKRALNTKVDEPTEEEEELVIDPSEADRVTDGPVGYVDEEKYAELSKAYDEMCQNYCDVCAEREAARTERDRALYTCNQLREANAELNAKLQCPTEDKYKKLYEDKCKEYEAAFQAGDQWRQAYVNLQNKINQLIK